MTEPTAPITTDDLHAFADDRLDPARRAAVAAYLEGDAEAAARVAAYRRQNAALHAALDATLDEPVPQALLESARAPRRPRRLPVAAALAGLLVGGVAGWVGHGLGEGPGDAYGNFAGRVAAAYAVYAPEVLHPVEVTAEQEDHLTTWLSKRMGISFKAPRLGDLDFELIGGRLMVGETAPAALLMYERGDGRRLVLYLRSDIEDGRPSGPRYAQKNGLGVLYWIDGATGFGLSGELDEAELSAAAHLVRAQLGF